MPAKSVTVYVCDRCTAEEGEQTAWPMWAGVIIPSDPPADAGQQLLCPLCVGQAVKFMAGQQVLQLVAPALPVA